MAIEPVLIIPPAAVGFGIQLPVQSQSTIYVEEWELASGPAEMARIARQADTSGFLYIAVCDHTFIPERLASAMGTTWYDTIATLGWLAGITENVRLLSHVYVAALRHPLRAAKEFATVDRLSGGRVIVGVGAGHVSEEFALLGRDFERRGGLLDEAIDAISAGLTDEFPELAGPQWPASGMGLAPRPVQRPVHRSGWAGRRVRRSVVPRHEATAGSHRPPSAQSFATRSSNCLSSAKSSTAAIPSRSVRWRERSMWARRPGSFPGAPSLGVRSRSPKTWPSSYRWEWRTYNCVSRAGRWTNCATRWRPSGSRSPRC